MITFLDGVSATGAGPVRTVPDGGKHRRTAQIRIDGTATVTIQGRMDDTMPWLTIQSYTASGADEVATFPEMRGNVSAVSGHVTVKMG